VRWEREVGSQKNLEWLEKLHARGHDIKCLRNKPEISTIEAPIYSVWGILSKSRQFTFGGPAPIPVSEIVACLDLLGLTSPDIRLFWAQVISSIDEAWREMEYNKPKQE